MAEYCHAKEEVAKEHSTGPQQTPEREREGGREGGRGREREGGGGGKESCNSSYIF